MVRKILLVDPDKCTGCRICETVCSLHKEGECAPSKSRVRISSREFFGADIPLVCVQCKEAPCITVCPENAISRDLKTGAMVVDPVTCIGCRLCLKSCPFHAISIDIKKRKSLICDLCEGNPTCVAFCPTGAIEFLDATKTNIKKKDEATRKLCGQIVKYVKLPGDD